MIQIRLEMWVQFPPPNFISIQAVRRRLFSVRQPKEASDAFLPRSPKFRATRTQQIHLYRLTTRSAAFSNRLNALVVTEIFCGAKTRIESRHLHAQTLVRSNTVRVLQATRRTTGADVTKKKYPLVDDATSTRPIVLFAAKRPMPC